MAHLKRTVIRRRSLKCLVGHVRARVRRIAFHQASLYAIHFKDTGERSVQSPGHRMGMYLPLAPQIKQFVSGMLSLESINKL